MKSWTCDIASSIYDDRHNSDYDDRHSQAEMQVAEKASSRDAMIDAAASLIRQRGVSASGMQDIVTAADAPRGSIYHHFPGGKDDLVIAALDRVSATVVRAIAVVAERSETADQFVAGIAAVFRVGSERADWTEGCPVAATIIEGDRQSPAVRAAIAANLLQWQKMIAAELLKYGIDDPENRSLMILGALEGALLLSRGLRSPDPYDAAVALLRQYFQCR